MSDTVPRPPQVRAVIDAIGPPGTPVTTPEVADEFECTTRTIYNKLERLVEDDVLRTKKVGANARVWWRPPGDHEQTDGGEPRVTADGSTERKRQKRLQEEQTRLLERIASGAPLEECLSSLCTTVSTLNPSVRASIVLTDDENQSFERCIAPELSSAWREELVGLPIDDRQIGTCGEAVFRGTPVTCEDVETNERWSEEWTELCLANDVLAGHSVPIHDEDGDPLGSFMLCFDEPRTPDELELLSEFGTHVASIALERERKNRSLRESENRLADKLTATQELQTISTSLIQEDDADALYEETVDAAVEIMDADFASIQRLNADRNELELLAHRGFSPEAVEFWEWVDLESSTTCGEALHTSERAVVPDVEAAESVAGTDDLETFRQTGIQAVQTTPLVSRDGNVLGMLSTHWENPHDPSEHDLDLFDVLARQVADLIERTRTEEKVREGEERLSAATDAAEIGVWSIDLQTNEALYTSPRYAEILGYDEVPEDWSLEQALDHYSPEDRERLMSWLEDGIGESMFESRITRTDGEQRWISVGGEVYEDGEGEPVRAVGTMQDITDRKRREERDQFLLELNDALRPVSDPFEIQSEASRILREQLGAMRVAYLEMNDDGTTCTCLAEDVDEDISFSFFDTVWDWRDFDPAGLDELSRGHTISREDVRAADDLTPEQKATFAEFNFRAFIITPLMKSGRLVGFFLAHFEQPHERDRNEMLMMEETANRTWSAVERARAEAERRENEARLDAATDAAELGIWELELQSDAPAVRSPRHDEIYGYEEPVEDWHIEDSFEHVHPDDRERVEAGFEEAVETGDWKTECRIIRADGEHRWISTHTETIFENDEPVRIIGTIQDITARKEREQQLERQREQIERLQHRMLETSPTGIFVVDTEGEITLTNDRAVEILGMAEGEIVGLSLNAPEFDIVDLEGAPIPDEEMPFERARKRNEAVYDVEIGASGPDSERVWLSVNVAPIYEDGNEEPTELVVTIDEITERKHTTEALKQLNTASRELMDADEQEILDEAAPLMQTVLDIEDTELWRYDSDSGKLHQADERADPPDSDDIRYPDGFEERAWQTFIGEDLSVNNDLPPHPDGASSETAIRSEVIVPLGRHGVLCAGSIHSNQFDETMVDLAQTVAANVEAGLDRAEREGTLATRTDALTRLDGLNTVIRQIDQALAKADTREEIDRVVCERLADSDLYEFAWIGQHDAAADTIEPQEWAGVDSGYVDDLTITTDDTPTGQGPVGTAVRTRETQVVEEIATDPRFDPWRKETLAQGVRSCLSIPLVYEDALYGVLNVYAGALDTDEKDRAVLTELGETIAHAISAVETKETLHTDRVVELTLGLEPTDSILGRIAAQAGCWIEFEGFVPQTDDSSDVFFSAHETTPDEIQAAGSESVAVESLTRITDRADGCLFKARLSGPTLASQLVEQDAVIRTLTFESDDVMAVVDLPSTATVREFTEAIQTAHSNVDLRTRRTRERAFQSPHEFKTAVEDRLTARQQEILRTAYLSGFFQSPRESTGQEISELLEISQPTFTHHLRAGQHNLFELLFDEA